MKKSRFDHKLIILGFDGMSPEVMEPMMRGGELPNFSELMRSGSYERLATTNPSQSPVAWAAFATGKNPGENGIFDFITRDPKTYKLSLSISDVKNSSPRRVLKGKAFWQYTSEARIPTFIIDCPLTFPPQRIYGRMLSGMGVPDILGTEGTFSFYTTEPLPEEKEPGGKVFHVDKSRIMKLKLTGPRVYSWRERSGNLTAEFQASLQGKRAVRIAYQGQDFELKEGSWSGWKTVTFGSGLKKIKGILQFYLSQAQPEFKLYVSPINFDPRAPFLPISFPKDYSRELADNVGLYHTLGMPLDTWAVNEKRLSEKELLSEAEEIFKEKSAILDFELRRFKKGVFFFYFGLPDTVQHMFWRYRDPGHPLYQKDPILEYRHAIEDCYKKMDEVLAGVMQKIGEEDTLIVMSDHGFSTFRRAAHINSWLRKNGYLHLNRDDAGSGSELLRDVDWSKTQAYAIGFGAIYINQIGREAKGIVKPGEEAELLKARIAAKLEEWLDKDNKPLIRKVYRGDDIFRGKYKGGAPDLYVGFYPGYRASWQTALGACPVELVEDNLKKWSGDHLFDPSFVPGVIFTNRKIVRGNPSVYDIPFSILRIAGFSDGMLKDRGFDGKMLFSEKD